MKKLLIFITILANSAFADTPIMPPIQDSNPEINIAPDHSPQPPTLEIPTLQAPIAPNQVIPPAPTISNFNNSGGNNQQPPIFTLTEDDKKNLDDLNKFEKELDTKIKTQVNDFEDKMKTLRALSQQAYDKLSHEAKLALKSKKDKINQLSETAKKTYYRNEL